MLISETALFGNDDRTLKSQIQLYFTQCDNSKTKQKTQEAVIKHNLHKSTMCTSNNKNDDVNFELMTHHCSYVCTQAKRLAYSSQTFTCAVAPYLSFLKATVF